MSPDKVAPPFLSPEILAVDITSENLTTEARCLRPDVPKKSRDKPAPPVVLIPPENSITSALSKKGLTLRARLLKALRKHADSHPAVGGTRGPP
jgi:hypothetical protein